MTRVRCALIGIAFLTVTALPSSAIADPIVNLALNPSRTGLPSPMESNAGWGGGTDTWDIVDGQRSYPSWANGLAFPYTSTGSYQATITFAGPVSFNQVIIWHHGYYPTSPTLLDYWDGTLWQPITYSRQLATLCDYGPDGNWAGSISDIYDFDLVEGSKVRFTIPQNSTFVGAAHGWIYEFEVYNVPEPGSLLLLGTGLLGLARACRSKHRP